MTSIAASRRQGVRKIREEGVGEVMKFGWDSGIFMFLICVPIIRKWTGIGDVMLGGFMRILGQEQVGTQFREVTKLGEVT